MAWRTGSCGFICDPSSAPLDGVGVREQAFSAGQCYRIPCQTLKTVTLDCLYADALHEIGGGKSTAHPRPAARRQNVIAAANLVSQRLRSPRPKENRASRGDFLKQVAGFVRKAQVFWCKAVREGASCFQRWREQDCAGLARG